MNKFNGMTKPIQFEFFFIIYLEFGFEAHSILEASK